MATVQRITLVCDGCEQEEDTAGPITSGLKLALGRKAPVELDLCSSCQEWLAHLVANGRHPGTKAGTGAQGDPGAV